MTIFCGVRWANEVNFNVNRFQHHKESDLFFWFFQVSILFLS